MNTSQMYFNKFSSGTILALLALSGMLFLVPLAVPAHASQNTNLPTLTPSITSYISGAAAVVTTVQIANPIGNAYAITSITFFAPTGFAFDTTATCAGSYLTTVTVHTASAVTCTGSLPPGFTDTVNLKGISTSTASPATAAPPTGTFTTTLIDAGSTPGSYPGPSWTAYDLNAATVTAVSGAVATFTAGGSPETITVSDGSGQPGVPYTFTITAGGYPHSGYTASLSPTSALTGSTGEATTTFTPSNYATDATSITATSGGGAGVLTGHSITTTTQAGSPSTVGWTYAGPTAFGVGKTFYLTGATYFGTSTVAGATEMGEFPAGAGSGPFAVSVSDAYGNAIPYGSITSPTITISASGGSGFDNGGSALLSTISCTTPAAAVNCATGAATLNYFQGYTYGFVGSLTAIITGQYPGTTPFSVTSSSGNLVTGTQATSYPLSISAGPYGAGTSITLTATPNAGTQPGVPVTFNLCGQQTGRTVCAGTTVGYGGSFGGAGQTGHVSNTGGSTGTATATYSIDTTLGHVGTWNDTAPAPTTATPSHVLGYSTSGTITTVAGAASSFKILVYYGDQATVDTKSALVSGQTYYIVVELVDAYGNLATNPGPSQVQIQLSANGGATLSATTVYIASGGSATNGAGSFGPIQLVIPASVSVGTTITLSASGVVSGTSVSPSTTLTDVTPLPSFDVKSPTPTSGTIYSPSTGVSFTGWANVSAGYNPTTATISSINYKIGSNHWLQAAGAGTYNDKYVISLFMPVGLSTITFNATDSNKNTVVSQTYNVLVDTQPPTFSFAGTSTNTGCEAVTVTTTEGDFNTASFAATWNSVAIPSGSITWSGTQTAGTAGSLTANVCGLTSQTATLSVSGNTIAGMSGSNSESLTVTVPFADSIGFNTAGATYGTVGAFSGVTVSVTNSWNTAQTIVVYATLKAGTNTYVAEGTVTVGSGATASVFLVDLQSIPAGTYQVTFSAVTTANQAVSAPTTAVSLTT